jgi:hypothetical protein
MTKEQKDLLLKDLCGRLPYGVKFKFKYAESSSEIMRAIYLGDYVVINSKDYSCEINDIKPYLFPMSSMTEEQKMELTMLRTYVSLNKNKEYLLFDWLNANHFDYRGLIDMGLAINVTNLNIY